MTDPPKAPESLTPPVMPLTDVIQLLWITMRQAQHQALRPADPTPCPAWLLTAIEDRPTVPKLPVAIPDPRLPE